MSNIEGNQQGNFACLINPYGKPISRLARTKDNHQDSTIQSKPSEQVKSKPSLLVRKGRNEKTPSIIDSIIPVKISQLSSNVVFQDIDSPHKSIQQSPKQRLITLKNEIKPEITSLTGSNQTEGKTHHKKITIQINESPTKSVQGEQNVTPKNSQVGSSTPKNRFSRNRQPQLYKVEKKNELSLNINSEKSVGKDTGEITDRTAVENSRKIERKLDGSRREIKFKKEIKSQIIIQQTEKIKKIEKQQPNSKTQISQLKYSKKQLSETVQQEKSLEQNLLPQQLSIISKAVMKRSSLISFVIKKLLFRQLASTFYRLKLVNYGLKIKFSKEITLLSKSIQNISINKQRGLIKWSFDILKANFSLRYINELKNVLLYKPVNRTQISLNIIQKICQSKLRKTWNRIKMKHLCSKNQIKALNVLDRFSKKKESKLSCQSFQIIKRKTRIKLSLLNTLTSIFYNFNKNKVRLSFIKLSSFYKSQLIIASLQKNTIELVIRQPIPPKEEQSPNISKKTNPALQAKSQKLKSTISQFKDSLTLLTKKLQQIQSRSFEQKNQLEQKIKDLKQSNKQIWIQLNTKKANIQTIQIQMSNITTKIQTKIIKNDQIQIQDEKLTKLTKVYMGNLTDTDHLLTPAQILNEYQLNVDNCTKSYEQWQLLAENTCLKRHIAVFQNSVQFQYTARKVGVNQQLVVAKLLRNYIRQQYFRQWFQVTSQTLLLK